MTGWHNLRLLFWHIAAMIVRMRCDASISGERIMYGLQTVSPSLAYRLPSDRVRNEVVRDGARAAGSGRLGPARGILIGLGLSLVVWTSLGLGLWLVVRLLAG